MRPDETSLTLSSGMTEGKSDRLHYISSSISINIGEIIDLMYSVSNQNGKPSAKLGFTLLL
jgi:hypothetical protein